MQGACQFADEQRALFQALAGCAGCIRRNERRPDDAEEIFYWSDPECWGGALIRRVLYSPAADERGAAYVTDSDSGPALACGGTHERRLRVL
jgi:hypothetical protein